MHLPKRLHRRRHLLRPSLHAQSTMLTHRRWQRLHPVRFSSQADTSSRTILFVLGPIAATTTATNPIATANIANTAGTPRTSTAPTRTEENAALSRLQLYVKPTPVPRSRVGNNSAW